MFCTIHNLHNQPLCNKSFSTFFSNYAPVVVIKIVETWKALQLITSLPHARLCREWRIVKTSEIRLAFTPPALAPQSSSTTVNKKSAPFAMILHNDSPHHRSRSSARFKPPQFALLGFSSGLR
jgi:hypothetical protein